MKRPHKGVGYDKGIGYDYYNSTRKGVGYDYYNSAP